MIEFILSFFAPLTVLSGLYIIIHILFCIITLAIGFLSTDERFTCEGVNSNHVKNLCFVNYEKSSISWRKTMYWINFASPLISFLAFSLVISAKERTVKRTKNCKFHIYSYHFVRVALHFLFHLAVGLSWIILLIDSTIKLTTGGAFTCVISNSTFSCLDGNAEKKVSLSFSIIAYTGVCLLLTLLEMIVFPLTWKGKEKERRNWEEERGNGGAGKAKSSGCPDCEYFIMKFKRFPGMLSVINALFDILLLLL